MSAGPVRCFIAVELDGQARAVLGRLLDELRRSGADVKWVAAANLHLTLKFLGDVLPAGLTGVTQALKETLPGQTALPPFSLALDGVGAFPSAGNPRVVWVGAAEGRERLTDLASKVEKALAPLGFPAEARGFSPHLTLGRVRSPRNALALKAAVAGLKEYRGPRVRVERVVLFQSDLRPDGPVYTPLGTFPPAPPREKPGGVE